MYPKKKIEYHLKQYMQAKKRIDCSYLDYREINRIKKTFSKNKVKITKLNSSLTNPDNPSSFEGFLEIEDGYLKIIYKDPLPLSVQEQADYKNKRLLFDIQRALEEQKN